VGPDPEPGAISAEFVRGNFAIRRRDLNGNG
jgi:hypothetical protein